MRFDVFDENNRKRPAPAEPTDGLDPSKRQRLGVEVPAATPIPPLPPGPVSYRQLYTLDPNASTANFDVQVFQDQQQLLRILVPILQSIDEKKLGDAINAVRFRYLSLAERKASGVATAAGIDDEEEYEPDFEPEDAEQIVNRLDGAPSEVEHIPNAPLAPYKMPEAPPLTDQEVQRYSTDTVGRVVGMMSALDEPSSKLQSTKGGFNRLAANSYDRDSWITILSRLATRASAGLDDPEEGIKSDYGGVTRKGSFVLSDIIRDCLYNYIIRDWKKRLDLAINWLNEEWYNDRLQADIAKKVAKATMNGNSTHSTKPKDNYHRCALRIIDAIVTYVEGTDKILIRFLSEMPEINREILQRMQRMAEDPDRIDLAIKVLIYLHMFRPPVREICADVLEDMWRTSEYIILVTVDEILTLLQTTEQNLWRRNFW
jgi:symplekin